jgi:hypothetical protein
MVRTQAAAFLSLLALAACGDDGGSTPAEPDGAPIVTPDAAPLNFCTAIEASYPDIGAVTGTATLRPVNEDLPDGIQAVILQIPLNEESPPDVLFVEIWEDSAPFDSGTAPYMVNLIGDNADLVLCAACTYIAADFTDPMMIDFNMAYSGQLALSVLDSTPGTGKVTGTLTNVKMHEVTISVAGQSVVTDGCKSTLEKVSFDFDVAASPTP